jgi:hypothetical protein
MVDGRYDEMLRLSNREDNDITEMSYTRVVHSRMTKLTKERTLAINRTPSQIHEEGRVPMTKHPTHPRTHIEVPNGPQMAISSIQTQSLDERDTPMSKGSRRHRSDGERRHH